MRVLIVTNMYPTSTNPAFGSFVRTQVECLRRSGIDVELLVLEGRNRKLIYPRGVFQLRRRLTERTVDLVHAHYSYTGIVARTQFRVPVVVTFHGSDINGVVDAGGGFTRSSRLISLAGRLLARSVDAVIVQNQAMARKVPGARAFIVPHEIDFDTFRPTDRDAARRELGLDPDRRYLLFAARPDNWVKGYPVAEQAAARLAERDPTVELLVVHQETQDRLAHYMSACDALVFPSISEGSPNVVKQAMACNLPIVASDVGDIREVIGDTEWCQVVDRTPEAFAAALEPILREQPRTTGRSAVQRFNCPQVAQAIREVYEFAIARHGLGARREVQRL